MPYFYHLRFVILQLLFIDIFLDDIIHNIHTDFRFYTAVEVRETIRLLLYVCATTFDVIVCLEVRLGKLLTQHCDNELYLKMEKSPSFFVK